MKRDEGIESDEKTGDENDGPLKTQRSDVPLKIIQEDWAIGSSGRVGSSLLASGRMVLLSLVLIKTRYCRPVPTAECAGRGHREPVRVGEDGGVWRRAGEWM